MARVRVANRQDARPSGRARVRTRRLDAQFPPRRGSPDSARLRGQGSLRDLRRAGAGRRAGLSPIGRARPTPARGRGRAGASAWPVRRGRRGEVDDRNSLAMRTRRLNPEVRLRHWWEDAVFYQIYPRSFADSNGDGIGDLAGIRGKLDYLEGLGVDALWISPFFKSPMKDFGYDVSDYRDVDPMFGTLDDLKALVSDAKGRGIRIVLDLVANHSSDEHPWFVEARSSKGLAQARLVPLGARHRTAAKQLEGHLRAGHGLASQPSYRRALSRHLHEAPARVRLAQCRVARGDLRRHALLVWARSRRLSGSTSRPAISRTRSSGPIPSPSGPIRTSSKGTSTTETRPRSTRYSRRCAPWPTHAGERVLIGETHGQDTGPRGLLPRREGRRAPHGLQFRFLFRALGRESLSANRPSAGTRPCPRAPGPISP